MLPHGCQLGKMWARGRGWTDRPLLLLLWLLSDRCRCSCASTALASFVFVTQSSEGGVDVCLTCFNGGCTGASSMHHSARHASLCHPLVLNIRKRPIAKPEGDADTDMADDASAAASEPASKVTKLAIGGVGGVEVSDEPQFYYETAVRCLACHCDIEPASHPELARCVEAVMAATSSSRPTEIGWEDKVEENCPHCSSLQQVADPPQLAARALTTCNQCDVKDDMWLCLTCGALGCSRRQMIASVKQQRCCCVTTSLTLHDRRAK